MDLKGLRCNVPSLRKYPFFVCMYMYIISNRLFLSQWITIIFNCFDAQIIPDLTNERYDVLPAALCTYPSGKGCRTCLDQEETPDTLCMRNAPLKDKKIAFP